MSPPLTQVSILNHRVMKYHVLVRNGWDTKIVTCRNFDEARGYARWAAFLLDIKTKETLPKKDWTYWDSNSCFFEYDITSAKYKNDASKYIHIRSQHLPKSLYGKSITQIEKHLVCLSPYMANKCYTDIDLKSSDKNH